MRIADATLDSAIGFDSTKAFDYMAYDGAVTAGPFACRAEVAHALDAKTKKRWFPEDTLESCYSNSGSSDLLDIAVLRRGKHEGTLSKFADFLCGSLEKAEAKLAQFSHMSETPTSPPKTSGSPLTGTSKWTKLRARGRPRRTDRRIDRRPTRTSLPSSCSPPRSKSAPAGTRLRPKQRSRDHIGRKLGVGLAGNLDDASRGNPDDLEERGSHNGQRAIQKTFRLKIA